MTSVVFRLSLGTLLSLLLTVGTIAQQPVPERQLAPSHAPNMPVVKLHVSRFKLLTATTGWASTGSELLLTTDAGTSWKKITPPIRNAGRFADVLFLNPMAGWVLYRSDSDDADFIVAMTVNGGGTWTISKIKVSPSYPENGGPELGRSAQLAFTNTSSGYLLFDYQTGSAFSSAGMYATTDGGRTWHATDNNPGFFGSIRGYSNGDLWAVDGYGRQLMVSRNGTGFSDFSLATPPGITSSEGPRYTLPVFVDNTHGYLAVTYEGGPGANSTATLFETEDGGHTWNSDRMVSNLISGVIAPTDIADSNWILAFVPKGASAPSLTKIGPNSHIEAPPSKGEGMSWSLDRCEIDFVAAHQGWANCAGDLLLTNDGGASWSSISPRARNGVITQDPLTPPRSLNAPQSAKRASSAKALTTPSVPYLTALDQHLGFDTKYAPSTAIMEEWWNSSPYYDIGIYLPGSPSGPVQPSLNADWVTTVIGYGWGLIPIWSGPQPPCACSHPTKDNPSKIFPTCNHFAHVFSENAATATNDGITQADHAYNSATLTLGLDGNSI